MDINDNQQLNTFTKGMNTDVSDMLMDSSQYRYAENVRLVTNTESNSGELRVVDGTELAMPGLNKFPDGEIKAMSSIRDIMIVVGQSDNIYVYDTSDNKGWVLVYEPKEGELFGEYLSIVTRYENEKLIKVYMADGKNQLMYINIAPYIKYDGDKPDPIEGIDNIVMNVEEFIKPILAEVSEAAGTVPGVKVLYAYRYYKLGGAASQISPLSDVVTIYKTSNEGFKETDQTTSKSVVLTLPKALNEYIDMMLIYRISYIQVGQLPMVNIIYDEAIMLEQQYVDNGQSVLSVDAAEFLSTVKFTFIPKVIESKNNYLFAGNIKYIQSDIDSKISDEDIRCKSSGDYDGETLRSYNKQFSSDNIMTFDPQNWMSIKTSNKFGGDGTYISWTYNIRRIAIDRDNNKYIRKGLDLYEKTEDLLRSLRQGEVYRYGAILYDEKGNKSSVKWIADIMSPVLKDVDTAWLDTTWSPHKIGLLPSERRLNDSSISGIEGIYFYDTYQIGIDFKIKSLPEGISGIEIVRVNRTISDRITLTEGIGGFPYRIYHKNTTDSQEYSKTLYICPTGYMSTTMMYADSSDARESSDAWLTTNRAISDNNYLMFSSPEYVYQQDDVRNIIKTYKNNINLDIKYNIHCQNGNVWRTGKKQDDDGWGISDWVTNNGGLAQSEYSFVTMGAGRKPGSSSEEGHSADIDLNYGACFLDSKFIPNFVRENIDVDSLADVQSVWCYIKYCAFANTDGYKEGQESTMPYVLLKDEEVMNTRRWNMSACLGIAQSIDVDGIDTSSFSIKDVGYPNVPEYDTFFGTDEKKTNWANEVIPVGSSTTYSAWSSPLLLGVGEPVEYMKNEHTIPDWYHGDADNDGDGTNHLLARFPVLYPTGSTGKCMVLRLSKPMKAMSRTTPMGMTGDILILSMPIIRMRKVGVMPYNGESTIKTSTYISYGNMVTQASTKISVFDGDCYPGLFVYNASHAWYEPNTPAGIRQSTIYIVPIESDIDLSATYGDTYNKLEGEKTYYAQDKACAIVSGFALNNDAYLYNTAYGAQPNAITYSAIKYTTIDTSTCDTRVHHSQPKVNGEHIDNWLNYKALDFLDVDSRFGEITNMRLFKENMLYWQNNATGILSINERTVLSDVSDNLIILGTGDVLQRYDYISTAYGMLPNQYEAETQSNNTQYYWDEQNKEILAYAGGMELLPLTKAKAVMSYINSGDCVDHPSLSYDKKFNELISSVVDAGSIVYNEQTLNFTSVYTFNPTYRTTINDRLYYNDGSDIYITSINKPKNAKLFDQKAKPLVSYVVNKNAQYNKVFDISTFGGRFYGGDSLNNLMFDFKTPLKQHSTITGSKITNREYDFRLNIPRNEDSSYGDRMRGKTMQCELSSDSNSTDFSLQYVITKYRMSWS